MSFPTAVLALSLTGTLVFGQLYTVIPLHPLMAADRGNEPGTAAWAATAFAGFGFPAVSLSAVVILGAGALLALGSVARFQAGRRL